MRLICPNCGAQYAVADDVIPAVGRDVQCSNCAHTWFETPGASARDRDAASRRKPTPAAPPPPVDPNLPFSGSIEDAFKQASDDDDLSPAPQPPKDRRTVDPSVADILREEAALEQSQRRAEEPQTIESQSDFALDEPAAKPAPKPQAATGPAPATKTAPEKPAEPASDRPTDSKIEQAKEKAATAAASVGATAAASRELLPDIEEINSSLSAQDDESDNSAFFAATEKEVQRKSAFRGFAAVICILALLFVIYWQADAIKGAAPALAGAVDSYVAAVDTGRLWLDARAQSLTGSDEAAS